MGFLKDWFGKKQSACCEVKIEEVEETKDACCQPMIPADHAAEENDDSCCKQREGGAIPHV